MSNAVDPTSTDSTPSVSPSSFPLQMRRRPRQGSHGKNRGASVGEHGASERGLDRTKTRHNSRAATYVSGIDGRTAEGRKQVQEIIHESVLVLCIFCIYIQKFQHCAYCRTSVSSLAPGTELNAMKRYQTLLGPIILGLCAWGAGLGYCANNGKCGKSTQDVVQIVGTKRAKYIVRCCASASRAYSTRTSSTKNKIGPLSLQPGWCFSLRSCVDVQLSMLPCTSLVCV